MDSPTLSDLLDVLGGDSVRALTTPAGLTAPVGEVLLYDADAPLPRAPGAVLLAVGVRARSAAPLLRAAADAGMAAVVVRGASEEGAPVAAADRAGIALLCVDEDAAWHRVHLLLSSAAGAGPAPAAGGDLFALADAIAAAVGGATAIEDPRQRILAYSTVAGQPVDEDRRQGILGLQVPDSPENTEQYRAMFAAGTPLRLPALDDDNLPRLAVAVRAGGETLGSVWVVDGGNLAPDADHALAQGASTAALLLLRARAAQELSRHLGGDLLRRVLDGTADASTAAHRLGFGAGTDPVRVAAFAPAGPKAAPDVARTALRLLDLVRLSCEARYGRHACVLLDGVVYALLPASDERGAARHKPLAQDIVERAKGALRTPVRAALGALVPGLARAVDSRDDADLVLRCLSDELPVAAVEQVQARVTLLRIAELAGERRELTGGAWARLRSYDAEHATEYCRTVRAWLDAGCDMAGAAKSLAVHPNTCRYRLRQVREQVGLDLDDPDERLVVWLQARLGD
ncbi:CdaR family transcriptional regulator [Streptomyces sp. VRA16 Mangrove soil]|uniref:PucR family transcriptional regulator n=1 Tax=Streptomyces sp. VRA16 Mangrove soil TaxID=2817434 RepID=UPI001A9E0F30|nr:PucR family transcriptional regulator [Streptomyces sp. VRA16 Mangrove soil]MBO1337759.1 helix-turn-helix domain-containing protein [Streptomyces sp. VRA16 Mangrove soil]